MTASAIPALFAGPVADGDGLPSHPWTVARELRCPVRLVPDTEPHEPTGFLKNVHMLPLAREYYPPLC